MKQETLYIKIDQNILLHNYHVTLGDIAKMECTEESILRQLKQKKIYSFPKPKGKLQKQKQHQVVSILKIIALIHEDYPNVDVQNMGETDFVIEYDPVAEEKKGWQILKTAVLCILIFFGAAFTIMAFHNDIDINNILFII